MRILVTGASGFIGAVLCSQLLERGHEVGALVRRTGSAPHGTRGLVGDLRGGPGLSETLAIERPDCVIHLAAEIASQRSESKILEVNVQGTQRLLRPRAFSHQLAEKTSPEADPSAVARHARRSAPPLLHGGPARRGVCRRPVRRRVYCPDTSRGVAATLRRTSCHGGPRGHVTEDN